MTLDDTTEKLVWQQGSDLPELYAVSESTLVASEVPSNDGLLLVGGTLINGRQSNSILRLPTVQGEWEVLPQTLKFRQSNSAAVFIPFPIAHCKYANNTATPCNSCLFVLIFSALLATIRVL